MKLYDIFYQTLVSTNDMDEAIRIVEKEILKRKTSLENINENISEKLDKMIELQKKAKKLEFLLNNKKY